MKRLSDNKLWLLSVGIVSMLTLVILFGSSADRASAAVWADQIADPVALSLFDQEIFNEDFTVEAGEVVNESVTVFRGNVDIAETGQMIGDLAVFNGNVEIAGTLDGDLAVIGGDVSLRDSARVTGDLSVVGGSLDRAEGAFVGGNSMGGPRGNFENFDGPNRIPEVDVRPDVQVRTPDVRVERDRPYFLSFFLRLLQSVLWTLLITGLVVLLSWLFPRQIKEIRNTGQEQPALSFAVGLVVALGVLLVGAVLFITVCLAPFSVLLWALLALVTLVGWSVLSAWAGDQVREALGSRLSKNVHPLISVALGALLLTGVTFFAWSILPCLGWIAAILLGATGNGAVLVHLARRSNFSAIGGSSSSRPSTDGSAAGTPSGVVVRDPSRPQAATTPTTTVEPTVEPGVEPIVEPTVEPSVEEAPVTDQPDAEETSPLVSGDELGLSDEERRQLRQGAGIGAPADDFTQIRGIGPAFSRRLQEAGVLTFEQLAAMSAEQIGEIVGWPVERVVRDQLREQALSLAAQS